MDPAPFEQHEATPIRPRPQDNLRLEFPATVLVVVWAAFLVYGSLLPFDFQMVGLDTAARNFIGSAQSAGEISSLTDWITNIVIFIPLGFFGFASVHRGHEKAASVTKALAVFGGCLLLAIFIEFFQTFFPPRDSSWRDVLANGTGAAAGFAAWRMLGSATAMLYAGVVSTHSIVTPPQLKPGVRIVFISGVCLMVAGWSGALTANWLAWTGAAKRIDDIRFLPFLQHQAADIGLAFVSTVMATITFAVLGGVVWLLGIRQAMPLRTQLLFSATLATGVAVTAEAGKFFMATRNPDTGNILVAGFAAVLGCLVVPIVWASFRLRYINASGARPGQPGVKENRHIAWLLAGRLFACAFALATVVLVATYPVGRLQLAIAMVVYAAILVRFPTAWLYVLPALLPVLDLAPWTGRFFFDEFDAFVTTTLAFGLWHWAGAQLASAGGRIFWLTAFGFVISLLLSAIVGMFPLQPIDANALSSYFSHYASLRAAKGPIFAVGLGVLLSWLTARGHDTGKALSIGLIFGLVTATGSVIWERLAYAGLSDFAKEFRVVGLFSTMNTGGAHLDAFLVTTLPFAAIWAMSSKRLVVRLATTVAFFAGTYAVMMTFSRAAVMALIISVLVVGVSMLLSARHTRLQTHSVAIRSAIGLALATLIISPIWFGSFMQSRLATSNADLGIRKTHWNESLGLMTEELKTSAFGMGLGRYPEAYLLFSTEKNKPAVHQFRTEGNNTFLRIQPGATAYVEQIVRIEPRERYSVTMKARSTGGNASINVLLCDRTFLQGYECQSVTFQPIGQSGEWRLYQGSLFSGTLGENGLRITKLSLENGSASTSIDIDELALTDPKGLNQIANGDFQSGADRWYFSSPYNHLPWHIKNLWLEVFFEQGWFGLILLCALIAASFALLTPLALQGNPLSATLVASMAGFLAVGGFDSMFDAPRLILLFGLLIAATGVLAGRQYSSPIRSERPLAKYPPRFENSSEPPAVPRPTTLRHLAPGVFAAFAALAIAIVLVTKMPFVPYRIRELPNPFHPVLAPVLLAFFIFWIFGMPAFLARWLTVAKGRSAAFPLILALHGLIGWAAIQFAVLPNSIHAVIGSPVLNWPWQFEDIARWVPLFSLFAMQLTGGALIAAAMTGMRVAQAPVWWLICAALLYPIQYWVVVTQAATDNLIELIADTASFGAFLLLATYFLVVGIAGSLLASLKAKADRHCVFLAFSTLAVSLPLGYLLLWAGTESVIVKEQKAFSALQSLLSTDRTRYAVGLELWIRFVVAHLATVFVIALAQYLIWDGFASKARRRKQRMSS